MAKNKGTALRHDLKETIDHSVMGLVKFSADELLPAIGVKQRSGNVPVKPTSLGMKDLDVKRNSDGTFKRGEWVYSSDSFSTKQYGYEETVDRIEELENADYFSEEAIATQIAFNQMKLAKEKRMVDALFNTTTFTAAADTMTITEEWDDATNAVPFSDITTVAGKLFTKIGIPRSAITLVMNEVVLNNVRKCDEIAANLKYVVPLDLMTEAQMVSALAQYLGIKEIKLVNSFIDSTLLGVEDGEMERILTNEYMMACVLAPKIDSWKVPGVGRSPVWTPYSKDFVVESYYEDDKDMDVYRVREISGEWINVKYGVLIDNVTT